MEPNTTNTIEVIGTMEISGTTEMPGTMKTAGIMETGSTETTKTTDTAGTCVHCGKNKEKSGYISCDSCERIRLFALKSFRTHVKKYENAHKDFHKDS